MCAAYLDHAKEYYRKDGKEATQVLNIKSTIQYFIDSFSSKEVDDFTPLDLQAFQSILVDKELARTTVNLHINQLRKMFKWGVAQTYIQAPVYQALLCVDSLKKGRCQAKEPPPVRPIDDCHVEPIYEFQPPMVAEMVKLQQLTAMRSGELVIMRPIDIDRNDETWVYVPESHKSEHHGKERFIPLGPKAQAILAPYLLREESACCFQPIESEAKRKKKMRENRKSKVQPSQISPAK